nr:hypothetical protein [Tanacetum cinerariifolium]
AKWLGLCGKVMWEEWGLPHGFFEGSAVEKEEEKGENGLGWKLYMLQYFETLLVTGMGIWGFMFLVHVVSWD